MNFDMFTADYPAISDPRNFDSRSGSCIERLVFNHRIAILFFCLLLTLTLGYNATRTTLTASFEKMIPMRHPYIVNYFAHKEDLNGLGNTLRIAVETTQGTLFDAHYLATLRRINDDIFLLPGVDRSYMRSLWTPAVRWSGVTEEGLDGGPVMPADYNGSPASLAQVRANVERSGEIGQLVAANYRSSVIFVPLLERDAKTGQQLDYKQFSDAIEKIRTRYQTPTLTIYVTGFAKVMGDLIEGLSAVLSFFAIAALITAVLLYGHTRCMRSTLLVVLCSLAAVVWLLGLLSLLGHALSPYSVLVPFLIFAIGMSHGAQKMNGIMQDIGRGTHPLVAARYCFRRLFLAGLTALLADAVGFSVLMLIPIAAIQELSLIASMGVAVLIFTNLVLLPVLLSFVGVSTTAARCSIKDEVKQTSKSAAWILALTNLQETVLGLLTQRKWAGIVLITATVLGSVGFVTARHLKIGDLDPGAPELRSDSRYNRDNAFMTANYAASSDVLVMMVRTPPFQCVTYRTLAQVDALEEELQQLPEVISIQSLAGLSKRSAVSMNEGHLKWYDLPRTQATLNAITPLAPRELFNRGCDLLSVYVYLNDHKAETLRRVTAKIEMFADKNNTNDFKFLLAAGNAGIEAATNSVVQTANLPMLGLVYLSIALLCFATFRSWRAMLCALLPLALTSVLCEALMVMLGIGIKVATLPVIALGVGIGVDYALYVLTVVLAHLRIGMSLSQAYLASFRFTGKIVVLTGLTLGVAVGTWVISPIKFQADMGLLLAFMFIWNMLGTLILLPALATFLLGKHTRAIRFPATNTD